MIAHSAAPHCGLKSSLYLHKKAGQAYEYQERPICQALQYHSFFITSGESLSFKGSVADDHDCNLRIRSDLSLFVTLPGRRDSPNTYTSKLPGTVRVPYR